MKRVDLRCRAITVKNIRCSRPGKPELKGFCFQHSGNGGGGGLARKIEKALPIAVGAAELVRVIVEIIGPWLTTRQRDYLAQAESFKESELQIWLGKFLGSLDMNQYSHLQLDPEFRLLRNTSPVIEGLIKRTGRMLRLKRRMRSRATAPKSVAKPARRA